MTSVSVRLNPAELCAASASLRAGQADPGPIDPTLLTEEALGRADVAAAVAEYVTVRARRHAELAAHLAAVADALDQVNHRSTATDQDVRAELLASVEAAGAGRTSA